MNASAHGPRHIHFVTGRLAEPALREVLCALAPAAGFSYSVEALGISVAALMTADWVARRIAAPPQTDCVLLPGYCTGDIAAVAAAAGVPAERGPRDLRRLPDYFQQPAPRDYGSFDIEILAEINHAPRLPLAELLRAAESLRADGADVIDVGCDPGEPWAGVGEAVAALVAQGHRVSIDSLHPAEIAPAVAAGAELVLSVNATNRHAAADWGCEVVAIPDAPADVASLEATVEHLTAAGVRYRIDPVLEPVGFGFAASLGRYLDARRRYPDAGMLMGVGNLTELTDADSAAINVLLLGFCQELGIRSVLTTQVINWAQSCVRECDAARRLVYHAVRKRVLPKHVSPALVMLRDPAVARFGPAELDRMAHQIKDHNYRIFVEDGQVHVLSAGVHLAGDDAFELLASVQEQARRPLSAEHAFYLGYELAKALTALTLGKQYEQDEALSWGLLTRPERSRHHQFEEQNP